MGVSGQSASWQLILAAVLGALLVACGGGGRSAEVAGSPGLGPAGSPTTANLEDPLEDAPFEEPSETGAAPRIDLSSVRVGTAPGGLAGVDLPETEQEVRDLMRRMPAELAGLDRVSLDGFEEVGYGESPFGARVTMRVIDLDIPEFFPSNWRAGDVVAAMGEGSEAEGAPTREEPTSSARRDGDLFWTQQTPTETLPDGSTRTTHALVWGAAQGRWAFSGWAETPRQLDALLEAFTTAAAAAG